MKMKSLNDSPPHDKQRLLEFCCVSRGRQEIMDYMKLTDRKNFSRHYLKPLLNEGMLLMTMPGKTKSKNQKYVAMHNNGD